MWFCASIWSIAGMFLAYNHFYPTFNIPWGPPGDTVHLVTDSYTTTYFDDSNKIIYRRYNYAKPRTLAGGLLRGLRRQSRKQMLSFISDAELMWRRKSWCGLRGRRSLAYVARDLSQEAQLRLHAAMHLKGVGDALTVDDFQKLMKDANTKGGANAQN